MLLTQDKEIIEKGVLKIEQAEKSLSAMQGKRKDLFAKILQLEDERKEPKKFLDELKGLDSEIELAKKRVEKNRTDLKKLIGAGLDNLISGLEAEVKEFEKQEADIMRKAGEAIGMAQLCFQSLGPSFTPKVASLGGLLKNNFGETSVDFKLIEQARSKIFSNGESESLDTKRKELVNIKRIRDFPLNRGSIEKRLFFRAMNHDLD
jgi:hypothetical protein